REYADLRPALARRRSTRLVLCSIAAAGFTDVEQRRRRNHRLRAVLMVARLARQRERDAALSWRRPGVRRAASTPIPVEPGSTLALADGTHGHHVESGCVRGVERSDLDPASTDQ